MQTFTVYTDGSYMDGNDLHCGDETHGGVVFMGEGDSIGSRIHVYSKKPQFTSMWNVGGEIIAAYAAIQSIAARIKQQNEEYMETYQLNLVYDYEGIGAWLTGRWKAKKPATRWFVEIVRSILEQVPNLKVNYIWVRGHASSFGNNEADRVACYNMQYCESQDIPVCLLDEIIQL